MYMNQVSGVHEHQHEKHTASIQSNVAPASREIPKEVAWKHPKQTNRRINHVL